MSEEKVLDYIEDAPHIDLNLDGSSIGLSNWTEPTNRNWSYRHINDVLPFTQEISRGEGVVHEFVSTPGDLTEVCVNYRNREMKLEEYLFKSHCNGFLVLQDNDIILLSG